VTVSRIPNVEGGIQPTIVTAKGDLIAAVANASPGRLGVGSDGQLLTADSTAATGLSYQNNWAAGKNKIINGDFEVWQRGSSFTLATATLTMTADRYYIYSDFTGSSSVSRQTFTPGTAPVAGYEGEYFLRHTVGTTSSYYEFGQKIEDVRTFANQSATFSFWAKASTAITLESKLAQNFGSGGSTQVVTNLGTHNLTTSWQRFTVSATVPSVSGKTIGTSSYLTPLLLTSSLTGSMTIDTWGWQLEAGSVATAFQTATGTIQGELAACQRYYFRYGGNGLYEMFGAGQSWNNTNAAIQVKSPVTMRVSPTSVDYSTLYVGIYGAAGGGGVTSLAQLQGSRDVHLVQANVTPGNFTSNTFYQMFASNSTSAYIGFSAEL
jgi:hypothetical protein